jgi:hypothetical protein
MMGIGVYREEHVLSYQEFDAVPAYEQAVYKDGMVSNDKTGAAIWAGKAPPPAIGSKVTVIINNLGPAVVVGYFVEAGFLGLRVQHDSPPDWYIKQNKGNVVGHVFGPEVKL